MCCEYVCIFLWLLSWVGCLLQVNYFLVSQANPYLLPIIAFKRMMPRRLGSLVEAEFKHRWGLRVGLRVRGGGVAQGWRRSSSTGVAGQGWAVWPRGGHIWVSHCLASRHGLTPPLCYHHAVQAGASS